MLWWLVFRCVQKNTHSWSNIIFGRHRTKPCKSGMRTSTYGALPRPRSHSPHMLTPVKLNEIQVKIDTWPSTSVRQLASRSTVLVTTTFCALKNWNYVRIAQHWFKTCCRLIRGGVWISGTGSSGSSMPMVGRSLRLITSFSAKRPGFTGPATSTRAIFE